MPHNGSRINGKPLLESFDEGTQAGASRHELAYPEPEGRRIEGGEARHGLVQGSSVCGRLLCRERLEKAGKLVGSQAGFANERSQRPLRENLVVRNDQSTKRGSSVPKDHMAAPLTIDLVTDPREGADHIRTRNNRELAHTATSTISSSIEGGMASSWASRLSR